MYDHATAARRYEELHAATGLDAYEAMAGYHAAQVDAEASRIEEIRRADMTETMELPIVETSHELARADRAGCLPLVPLSRARDGVGGAL